MLTITQGPKALSSLAPTQASLASRASSNPTHFVNAGRIALGVRAADLALSK